MQTASEEIISFKKQEWTKTFSDVITSERDCCAMVRGNRLQNPYQLYLISIKYKVLFSHLRSTVSETAEGVIIHLIRSMSHFNKICGES